MNIDDFWVEGDLTDDPALQRLYAAQAGRAEIVVEFGSERPYVLMNRHTLPNDGTQDTPLLPAKQVPITWQGMGNDTDGPAGGVKPCKGTTIILGYQDPAGWCGVGARLQTLGRGTFRLRGLNLCATATPPGLASTALLLTTNTSLDIDSSVSFYGPSNRVGQDADCDAIILGGTTTSLLNGDDSAFQGYNTQINGPFFSACRRLVWARTYCNSIPIHVRAWSSCGNPLPEGAAIELTGGDDNCCGNDISGLIEMVRYAVGVKLTKALFNKINIQAFDAGSTTIATVLCEDSAYGNLILAGMPLAHGLPTLIDRTPSKANAYISNQAVEISRLFCLASGIPGYPNQFGPTVFHDPLSTAFQSKLPSGAGKILNVKRSMADTTNPGADVFNVDGLGGVYLGNLTNAGNISNGLPTGAGWDWSGRRWGLTGKSGADMEQDSGTGGSVLTLRNYTVRYRDHTGAVIGRVGWGKKGFAFGANYECESYAFSSTVWRSNVKVTADMGIGVGNSQPASALGTISRVEERFDASGNPIGWVPIYASFTPA